MKVFCFFSMYTIIADRVMRTRKQSGVRRILRVCKERVRVSAVNTRSQNSVRNNRAPVASISCNAILCLYFLFVTLKLSQVDPCVTLNLTIKYTLLRGSSDQVWWPLVIFWYNDLGLTRNDRCDPLYDL